MAGISESGHANNVANFNQLRSYLIGYGADYNPANVSLTLASLQALNTSAESVIDAVNSAFPSYNSAVAAREVAFKPLSKRVTRCMNFLKASGVTEEVYDQVRTVARKIKGSRASSGSENGISTSQMSYDSRTENFDKMILLLAGIPEYNPNEEELQVATLSAFCDDLKLKNNAVIAAEVPLSNARIARNNVLYADTTGLYDVAITVKNYVRAVFGTQSPQYNQIRNLKFKQQKI
jgi:hypothetical protein